jgi:two-component system sensor histidine kinase BaeS
VPRSLVFRLMLGQALVIAAGAGSLLIVELAVGPSVFHDHVRDALGVVPPDVSRHLDAAFQDATLIALSIAVVAATLVALGVSWLFSARLSRPILDLAAAASDVGAGRLDRRVSPTGVAELTRVGASFNAMAAALEQSEASRRALLADVSHELRTPIATLDGYLEGLGDGVVPTSAETWDLLRAQTARLARLADDLTTLSRLEDGRFEPTREPVSLRRLVEDGVRAAVPAFAAKGVALDAEAADVTLDVDRERLGEVLANLLENALRHTPRDGHVRVRADVARGRVQLSVADDGEGIPAEELDKVFERFHRVDRSRSRTSGGSGLGLAISRAIVTAHGGTIHAESEGPDRGARFVVELPR